MGGSAHRCINLYPVDSATGFPNTYRWIVICPVDSAFQRLNNHRAATQSVCVADCYFIPGGAL